MSRSRDPFDSVVQTALPAMLVAIIATAVMVIPMVLFGLIAMVRLLNGVVAGIANALGLAEVGIAAESPPAIFIVSLGLVFAVLMPAYLVLHLQEVLTWILLGLVVSGGMALLCALVGDAPADDFLDRLRFWS